MADFGYNELYENITFSDQISSYTNNLTDPTYNTTINQTSLPTLGRDGFNAASIYVPIVFGLTFAVGIIGNTLVVIVIVKQCPLKCVTNMYLLNLAIADLVFLAFCIPFTGIVYTTPWPFSDTACKMLNYVSKVTMAASVLTLTAMSIDRYYAVLKPVDSKRFRTPHLTGLLLAVIWIVSLCSLIPTYRVSTTTHMGTDLKLCYEHLTDPNLWKMYILFLFLLLYAIPMAVISLCYALMAQSLWRSVSPSVVRDNMMKALNYRKKVAKMLLVIVAVFAICTTPSNIIRVLMGFHITPVSPHIQLPAFTFGYMNSAMNPIIYAFMSQNFRKCFRDVFLGCKQLRASQLRPYRDPEELPRSVTMGVRLQVLEASHQKSTDVADTKIIAQ